eukprot:TRINITY_DN5169_c1_g1_i1.p1 TRINITY_DN5169_c1_g1~~TRINITY_DN5169_c1_g1_i1.p1  ORF type:complete len:84 (-),score=6.09 TRINITY_DN5169_c1_g1_i1:140-391(-)
MQAPTRRLHGPGNADGSFGAVDNGGCTKFVDCAVDGSWNATASGASASVRLPTRLIASTMLAVMLHGHVPKQYGKRWSPLNAY